MIGSVLKALQQGEYTKEVLAQALSVRGDDQRQLFELAQDRRREAFPDDKVEARSVIEISNVCLQACLYCNMAKGSGVKRYVMPCRAVTEMANYLYDRGRRVLLLQSGENRAKAWVDFVALCLAEIKAAHPDFQIILCMGNLSQEQYQQLKEAGADRYVIKFETSNRDLYHTWKPNDTFDERMECIHLLGRLGYKVGSGNMVGLPGQCMDDLVNDLLLVHSLDLAMMSCTVFIPGENSQYRDQPAGDLDLTLNCMALMRIMNPSRLMPTTSSLERLREHGQYLGLMAGANTVTVHDGTPQRFKELFPIYSTHRFTPGNEHLAHAVAEAGLTIADHPLM